jgi:hypothetical protein
VVGGRRRKVEEEAKLYGERKMMQKPRASQDHYLHLRSEVQKNSEANFPYHSVVLGFKTWSSSLW